MFTLAPDYRARCPAGIRSSLMYDVLERITVESTPRFLLHDAADILIPDAERWRSAVIREARPELAIVSPQSLIQLMVNFVCRRLTGSRNKNGFVF